MFNKQNISIASALSAMTVFVSIMLILIVMKILSSRPEYSYLSLGGVQFLLLTALTTLAAICILFYKKTKSILQNFFTTQTHPMNLAIFRIVFCLAILNFEINSAEIIWFSSFPKELQYPPVGMKWLLNFLPITPTLAQYTILLFKIFCFTAAIGLYTSFSLWMALLTGLYALGIPQFFGKVNHYHYILWFLGILASSRSGDFLSIDAIFASWRRADRGDTRPLGASLAYTIPLRFIWLLIGIIYFFPGFWKLWVSGLQWVVGDTMRNYFYYEWMGYDGWVAPLRIDHYPLVCKFMAFSGVVFELTFIFLLFSPILRWFPIVLGLIFHTMTQFLMRISFLSLQLSYVAFFNWYLIFTKLGKILFHQEITVIYDGNCKLCRRTIASLRSVDVFGRISYINMFDMMSMNRADFRNLDQNKLSLDMHVMKGDQIFKGFKGYREIIFRIPVLWPLLPFLYMWPITSLGEVIYRKIADSRSCNIKDHIKPAETLPAPSYPLKRLTIVFGIFLITANLLFGAYKIGGGWPFACFPTFEDIPPENYYSLEVSFENSKGENVKLNQYALSKNFAPERFTGLADKLLTTNDSQQKDSLLKAFWGIIAKDNPQLRDATKIKFYRMDIYIIPEKKHLNPISRTLIYELKLD